MAVSLLALPAVAIAAALTLAYLGAGVPLATASVLLFAYFLLCHAIAGNVASVAFPAAIALRALNQTFITPQAGLVLLVTLSVVTTVAAVSWWVVAPGGSLAIVAVQAVLTGAAMTAYMAVSHNTTRMADVNRERLAEGVAS
jgi:hypothetical protein